MAGIWLPTFAVIRWLHRASDREVDKGLNVAEVGSKIRNEELIKIGVRIVRSAASWLKYTKVGAVVLVA